MVSTARVRQRSCGGRMTRLEISYRADIWKGFSYTQRTSEDEEFFIGMLRIEIVEWCAQHIGPYAISRSDQNKETEYIEFDTLSDAVAFKLRWL